MALINTILRFYLYRGGILRPMLNDLNFIKQLAETTPERRELLEIAEFAQSSIQACKYICRAVQSGLSMYRLIKWASLSYGRLANISIH